MIEAGALRWHFPPGELRLSILWKAHVFADERAAALYDEHADDLTPERIVDVFAADLARSGVRADPPTHPFSDPAWLRLIAATYPIPRPTV